MKTKEELRTELRRLKELLNPDISFGGQNINVIQSLIMEEIRKIEEQLKEKSESEI